MSLSTSLKFPSTSRIRYGQAAALLEKDLQDRKYATGEKLPTLRELSASMGMNHRTVRRGIEELVQGGKLEVRHGVGVFVAGPVASDAQRIMRVALGCRSYMLQADKHHPVVSAYLMGAHRRFSSREVSVQTMMHDGYKIAEDIGDAILSQGIDGFIACAGGVSQADADFFARHEIPLVNCSVSPLDHPWAGSVTMDNAAALRQAMDHLRLLGHRHIAFVSWEQSGDKGAIHRLFDRMVFDYELGDMRQLHIQVPDPAELQLARMEALFDIKPFPTAVIVHDEFIAHVILASCRRRGICVPDDLSIASLHDVTPFGHGIPLTAPDSVRLNSNAVFQACTMLEQMIKGEPVAQRQITLVPELICKASTATVPQR